MNSKEIIRRAKKGRPIRQVAAVPFRLTSNGEMQVMLITSRSTQRFIVPKGWTMKGKSRSEAASAEAFEEAGVSGRIIEDPVGRYRYWKRLSKRFVLVDVTVYLLSVEGEYANWDEADARQRRWLSPPAAATLIDEPELASLVEALAIPQEH
jgi:8-oxo-dGTP pyrophosphatase MutT (NUDIX family)